MNRLQRGAVLTSLADQLSGLGNWCAEVHLEEAVYFLQTLTEVPFGYRFIYYKGAPFSFDLADELMELQADGWLKMKYHPIPYGPSLLATPLSAEHRKRYQTTLGKYGRAVEVVARVVAPKKVWELQRLAAALFVSREPDMAREDRARRLEERKPHLGLFEAAALMTEVDQLEEQAKALRQEEPACPATPA